MKARPRLPKDIPTVAPLPDPVSLNSACGYDDVSMKMSPGFWIPLACLLAGGVVACHDTRPNTVFDPVDQRPRDVRDAGIDQAGTGADMQPDTRPLLPVMVAWWKLDDSGTEAADSSGNKNHGMVQGLIPPQAWAPGRHAGAISFPPGMRSAGVQVPLSPSLQALRRITVAAWIRRLGSGVAVEPQSGIVSQQEDTELRAESFSLVAYGEDLEAFIATSNAAQSTGTGPLGAFSKGTATRQVWLHVAMTFDGSVLRLYRNGVELRAEQITRPLRLSSKPIFLGTNVNDNGTQPFEGLLDDVLICADALPPAAIAALASDTDPASVCSVRP
jgi:hypothetical protein